MLSGGLWATNLWTSFHISIGIKPLSVALRGKGCQKGAKAYSYISIKSLGGDLKRCGLQHGLYLLLHTFPRSSTPIDVTCTLIWRLALLAETFRCSAAIAREFGSFLIKEMMEPALIPSPIVCVIGSMLLSPMSLPAPLLRRMITKRSLEPGLQLQVLVRWKEHLLPTDIGGRAGNGAGAAQEETAIVVVWISGSGSETVDTDCGVVF